MLSEFTVPAQARQGQIEVKRSRFLVLIAPAENRGDAKRIIQQRRADYPDANHHCWAMIAGHPEDFRLHDQSDDGEPRGTAGKPMLQVLQYAMLGHCVAIVTRYFGGIKLGTGGLVRAYSQAVATTLADTVLEQRYVRDTLFADVPYTLLARIEHTLQTSGVEVTDKQFTNSVQLTLLVPPLQTAALAEQLANMSGGVVELRSQNSDNNAND